MNDNLCTNTEPQKRVLCLWLPNWPIQRLVVSQKELKRQRVVLFTQHPTRGQRVSAVSPLAARDGILIDMPISEAKSLLKRSRSQSPKSHQGSNSNAQFHIFEHDRSADQAAIEELADTLCEFSPIIGIEQTDWPSSIFLDVTGLAHLFGNENQLALGVEKHCQGLGYLTRVAIANTIGLTWGMARFWAAENDQQNPVIVLQAEKPPNPPGKPPNEQAANTTLSHLPIEALRLSESTTETLGQLGINWVSQLFQLSRTDLATRFGDEINRRIDQATGKIEEPIAARHQPPEFQAEQLLDFPTSDRETIEIILSRLIAAICKQMKARQQGALQWTVKLLLQACPSIEFRVNLFQPTATVTHVMQLVQMQLEQILQPHTRKRRVRKTREGKSQTPRLYTTIQVNEIIISVTSCVLLVERQRQLFDENPRLDKQSLAHLINRLTSRLGQQNVVYPTLQSGAQPEYAVRFKPLVDPRRRRGRANAKPKTSSHVMARPLRLLNPAIEINGESQTPGGNKIERPPALLVHNQIPQKVIHAWGPERIETGWWRGSTIRRDYWRIETETNQQFWIYRNLRNRKWFLQGEF